MFRQELAPPGASSLLALRLLLESLYVVFPDSKKPAVSDDCGLLRWRLRVPALRIVEEGRNQG
jgi:hypothetical protein